MRTMLTIQIPVQAGNAAVKDGRMAKLLHATLERLQPESAYFFGRDGRRVCQMVFDLASPEDIPAIAEPLFMELEAQVDLVPVMNQAELQAGLAKAFGA